MNKPIPFPGPSKTGRALVVPHRTPPPARLVKKMPPSKERIGELLKEAGLPENVAKLLQRPFIFTCSDAGTYTYVGTIVGIEVRENGDASTLCLQTSLVLRQNGMGTLTWSKHRGWTTGVYDAGQLDIVRGELSLLPG